MISRRLAVATLAAATLTRPARSEEAGEVQIVSGPIECRGYRAKPDGAGPFPTVLVAEDGSGIGGFIAESCRHLAQEGYLAIAPLLFAGGEIADDRVTQVLDATASWARENGGDPGAESGRVGAAGFGRGGRAVWLLAAASPRIRAAVAWYAPVGGRAGARSPAELAPQLHAPMLGLYGKADDISEAAMLRIEKKASDAGKTAEMVVYVGAGRDFAAAGRPSFREAAALDGWQRMLAWFRRYGVG